MNRSASARLIRRASSRNYDSDRVEHEDSASEIDPLLRSADEAVLDDNDEDDDDDDHYTDPHSSSHFYPNPFADLPVYESIWDIRRDIVDSINDPYSYDQLRAPRLNNAVVRPLLEKYYALHDISIVFCLLVNRMQFLRETTHTMNYQSVRTTRAMLCEILALRLFRQYDEDSSGSDGLLLLANVVIAGFDPFQNAPESVLKTAARSLQWVTQKRGGYERQITALEAGILSEAKTFLSCAACQKVVDAIYTGRIIYTPVSWMDILPDHYKHKPISIYNPRTAPVLNTYRLSVPRIRNAIEITQFIILFVLYIILMTHKSANRLGVEEIVFVVFTLGWMLDQVASMVEHGWSVYSQNLWSFLDVMFSSIFLVYLALRVRGVALDSVPMNQSALDWLAMGAPFLVPRLAFNIFSENLLFVSLRDMMSKFLLLTALAVWTFAGFFLAMIWLEIDETKDKISGITTGLWMVWVWFGLDGTGVARSVEFHWLLGPILMISFAILGNTLFLTILVSTLGETFSRIARHANGEIQFRRAVLTFQAVKSDAIFSYPPPFNIAALLLMWPLKSVLTPRWFHKVNITIIRILNAPLLLCIGFWERFFLWPPPTNSQNSVINYFRAMGNFRWFHVHGDVHGVFDSPPPGSGDSMSDLKERRRRKSMQFCGPTDGQGDQDIRKTLAARNPRGSGVPPHSKRQKSRKSRHGSFKNSKLPEPENNTTETRLERIEEMLEQIGHSLNDQDDDDA